MANTDTQRLDFLIKNKCRVVEGMAYRRSGSVKIVSVWDWDDYTIASAPTPRAAIDKAMKELKDEN